MKYTITEELSVPEGISVSYADKMFSSSKGSSTVKREFNLPNIELKINGNQIVISAKKGNKNELKSIKSTAAHIKNMFKGLNAPFVFKLEACNVHFPMTFKVDGTNLVINNFLGEKVPRKAKIMPGVTVEIKAPKITLSSSDIEAVGETATNIEKATKVKNRDRRVFQDGIFITEKPGDSK